jgi:hypothetical protein
MTLTDRAATSLQLGGHDSRTRGSRVSLPRDRGLLGYRQVNADTRGNEQGLRTVLARAHQAASRRPSGARFRTPARSSTHGWGFSPDRFSLPQSVSRPQPFGTSARGGQSAQRRFAPSRIAPSRIAPSRVTLVRSAPVRSAPVRSARRRSAPVRVAALRVALVRVALVRVARRRSAPVRVAPLSVAPLRVALVRVARRRSAWRRFAPARSIRRMSRPRSRRPTAVRAASTSGRIDCSCDAPS